MGGGRAFLSRSSIASALKVPTILLFVGGMMFLSGQGLFAASFFQGADGALATIPAGSTWAYVYPIKVLGAGRVFGDFADPAGGLVDLFVFGAAQYESLPRRHLPEPVFRPGRVRFVLRGPPGFRDLLPRPRPRRRIPVLGAGRPRLVPGRGDPAGAPRNRLAVRGRRDRGGRNRAMAPEPSGRLVNQCVSGNTE